MQIESMYV